MNLRSIILLLVFVFFIAHPAFPYNNTIRIEVMGSVTALIDTKRPDDMAIEDAFRKAVVKAVETIVPQGKLDALALILDDKIYSKSGRYILNYRILSREIMEDDISIAEGGVSIYNVSIEADISLDLLMKDLTLAAIVQEVETKTFAITIFNLRSYKGFELFRNNILKAKGVKMVHYISFSRDRIEMAVETSEGAQVLKQEIMNMDIKDWKIEAAVASGWFFADRIEVRFFPVERQVKQ